MGAKATKIEGTYLPDTPTLNRLRMANAATAVPIELTITPCRESNNKALLDPRSPNECRTPLNLPQLATETFQMPVPAAATAPAANENPFAQLRKRLLKGFALNDPRSPQLNRTPLILDEAIDRTLNMDDTFSDLFVETRAPQPKAPVSSEQPVDVSQSSSVEIESLAYEEDETMPCDMILPRTPPVQTIDPRSPSVGVERTPIMFCDDDEAEQRDTQMLEDILETLTLNLSNESSMASFVSASADLSLDEVQLQSQPQAQAQPARPANKHLERVRLGNKQRVAPRKPARASKPTQIYIDATTEPLSSTPKSTPNSALRSQRTPLGSVNKNRVHLRSRSVEKDVLKPKMQLQLQSFDDQLNPSERRLNVSSLRIMVDGDENNFEN